MDIAYELDRLTQRARGDKALRQELLETRKAKDPVRAFCDKCAELGYKSITVYELMTAGEAFCAEMLRSVNGGGVEAPDDWDDFYEMFFDELKRMD
jgi:phage/plasmid-associated DNA primase